MGEAASGVSPSDNNSTSGKDLSHSKCSELVLSTFDKLSVNSGVGINSDEGAVRNLDGRDFPVPFTYHSRAVARNTEAGSRRAL